MRKLAFILACFSSLFAVGQNINRLEYYFDTDPGFGNGIAIPITAAPDLTRDFTVPLNTVSEGFHILYARARSNGLWSLPISKPVFVQRNAQTTVTPLKRVEFFIDTDPGFGSGTQLTTSGPNFDQLVVLDLSTLPTGFHVLHVRSQDVNGRWSFPVAKPFFVSKSGSNIVALEYYYYNGSTKSATRIYNSFTPGKDVTIDFTAVLDGLLPNTSYEIHVTAINGDGLRSAEVVHTFLTPAVICDPITPPVVSDANHCGNGSVDLIASGATGTQTYVWYQTPTGGIAIPGETDGLYTTPILNTTTTYYVAIKNVNCEGSRIPVTAFINPVPAAPATTNNFSCGLNTTVSLSASSGVNGQYRWYTAATGGTAITGETNSSFVTPPLSTTTTYFVSINDGKCEGLRTPAIATINPEPTVPATTNNFSCGLNTTVSLSASGGVNGQYRWYTAATGGTAITGETNSSFVTPSLSTTSTYFVSINDGKCESLRTPAIATIHTIPSEPVVTASVAPVGNALTICSSSKPLTLSAPNGFVTYAWSTGETTQQITVSASGTYSVTVTDASGCSSPASAAISVTVLPTPCNNQPPVISTTPLSTVIGGSITLNLLPMISDANDNLIPSSLRVVQPPRSGASTTLIDWVLTIDYSAAVAFAGKDQLTIEVCDAFDECTQQGLEIDVIGDIEIYNGVSANNDQRNEFFLIQYIDILPDTQQNKVTIYNRWGDVVFDMIDYNNDDRVFSGLNTNGEKLPSGTYFYKIEFSSGRKAQTGYLSLKR